MRYGNTVGRAANEATLVVETCGELLKMYDDMGYRRAFSQAFTDFPTDVGFNNNLSAPQPDFVEGLEKREYSPFPISEHVKGAVIYQINPILWHCRIWLGSGRVWERIWKKQSYRVPITGQPLSSLGTRPYRLSRNPVPRAMPRS